MGTDKEEASESSNQSNYEAAVLDFLDREMAAVRPTKHREESGQEVDALVTDLIKQVITESDQTNAGLQSESGGLEDILSEFPPTTAEETPPVSEYPESSEKAANPPKEVRQDASAKLKQEIRPDEPFNPRIPNFALGMAPPRKVPMIAAACVVLLFAIGAAVYYLWGSSESSADVMEFQAAASAPAALRNIRMVVPATPPDQNTSEPSALPPAREPAAAQQTTPKPAEKSSPVPISGSAPAPPVKNVAISEPGTAAFAAGDRPTNPVLDRESVQVVVKPLTTQTSSPSPLTVASNIAIDKSVPPPMPDGISIANSVLERNPAQSVPVFLTGVKNPSPTSQTQTPASIGSRDLVPSVPISQVTPVYPELAIRSRTSGSVVLELQIDKEGRVVEATPISGPSVFYSESVKAAMQYRYRPATIDGTKVSSKSSVTMVFNLNR